jgi:hypothetical protein
MGTRVKAREDLPLGKIFIPKGTRGEIQNSFDVPGGGRVHSVRWDQEEGPSVYRNVRDGEFEVVAS